LEAAASPWIAELGRREGRREAAADQCEHANRVADRKSSVCSGSQSPSEPKQASRLIEIRLGNGHSIVVRGRMDADALSCVIDLLVQRGLYCLRE